MMHTTCTLINRQNEEVGQFSISLTKRGGLVYKFIAGQEPTWRNMLYAMIMIIAGEESREGGSVDNTRFRLQPSTRFDERFIPELIDNKARRIQRLPFTVEGSKILEHHFRMTYGMLIKVLLAAAFSYREDGDFVYDSEKAEGRSKLRTEDFCILNAPEWNKSLFDW